MLRKRDSEQSKIDILEASEIEFAEKGLYGTRIDEIAQRANINKRMIYEYFGNKEQLYRTVFDVVYNRLTKIELELLETDLQGTQAIETIIRVYFKYLRENPNYVNLLLWENLNKARYVKELDYVGGKSIVIAKMKKIIEKGIEDGIFREQIDTEQVVFSLMSYPFTYFSNKYTLCKLFSKDLSTEEEMEKRISSMIEMFLSYLCVDRGEK